MVEARRRLRSVARPVGVLAALLALADLFRWANRWYISTQVAPVDELWAAQLLEDAHTALVSALLWTVLAIITTGVGWRLRVIRHRDLSLHMAA